jgi:hypothetical protein
MPLMCVGPPRWFLICSEAGIAISMQSASTNAGRAKALPAFVFWVMICLEVEPQRELHAAGDC